MLAAALALAPLLSRWIPDIVGWLGGDDAESVATQVVNIAQTVAGSTDPAVLAEVISDPSKAIELSTALARVAADREKVQEEARTARLVATLADTANARQTTVTLAQTASPIAYLAPSVCLMIFGLFGFVMVAEVFGYGQGLSEATRRLLDYLAIAACGYAIGSSAGSAAKDGRQGAVVGLAAAAGAAVTENPPAPATVPPRRLFGSR